VVSRLIMVSRSKLGLGVCVPNECSFGRFGFGFGFRICLGFFLALFLNLIVSCEVRRCDTLHCWFSIPVAWDSPIDLMCGVGSARGFGSAGVTIRRDGSFPISEADFVQVHSDVKAMRVVAQLFIDTDTVVADVNEIVADRVIARCAVFGILVLFPM
jgi:hypothetical protein